MDQKYEGVQANGWLHVSGTELMNSTDKPVVLRGMSTYGMQWKPEFASTGSFRALKKLGANLIRIAMYTDEGGYLTHPEVTKEVFRAADAAIAEDMYVIVDWHILHDGNPMNNQGKAAEFFKQVSSRYADSPAVLYEICNEPNGHVTWEQDIKLYAEEIIPVIRSNSPKSVIIVGTPAWSQDVDVASQSPLRGENLMYACHFYAGTHGKELQKKIDTARSHGAPIFISEWGTTRADGDGGVFPQETQQWLRFMAERNLSWANWSLGDKNEDSAALRVGASPNGNWDASDLTASGKLVFAALQQPNKI